MTEQYGGISDEAVMEATGRSWEEWVALLDEEGAGELSHKEIAELLITRGFIDRDDGWWAQSVTVGYEYAKGRRVKGQTADAGFQLGVQRTLPVQPSRLWQFLTSAEGLAVWLGEGIKALRMEKGATYRSADGTQGEIRTVYPGEKLRLTWQLPGWENESTLQLYLMDKGEKTALRFHQEKLTGPEQRAEMKEHWQEVLRRIKAAI
jgi:uncharacterized protein YndB with AHSA1/START domain